MKGEIFGRLTVIKAAPRNLRGIKMWYCKCVCGGTKCVQHDRLLNGDCQSCGCLQKETLILNGQMFGSPIKHGDAHNRNGEKVSKEYRAWQNMKQRCFNVNHKSFKNYGGRGITVCKRWLYSFNNFLIDVGRAPGPEYSIDRINVDGNYTLSNVRWATVKMQANNRRCYV